jgi:dolichol-phosphate mannosyltransferase
MDTGSRVISNYIRFSVIVPCFIERENIAILVDKLSEVLRGTVWEIIFIDDCPDGTADVVRQIAQENRMSDALRIGRRGLSPAVLEAIPTSSAPYLAVIDADL